MVELISVISKKMKSVGRERGWMGLMGDMLVHWRWSQSQLGY
jgi:hypothetical protein